MAKPKTLIISSKDLGEDVKLMLCFTSRSRDLFEDHFPVVWQQITLSGFGKTSARLILNNEFAIGKVEIDDDQCVKVGEYTPISEKQNTTFLLEPESFPVSTHWTDPVPMIDGSGFRALNGGNEPIDVALCLIGHSDADSVCVDPIMIYPDIAVGDAIRPESSMVLSVYAVEHYEDSEVITDDIKENTPILEIALDDLQRENNIVVQATEEGVYQASIIQPAMGDSGDEEGEVESDGDQAQDDTEVTEDETDDDDDEVRGEKQIGNNDKIKTDKKEDRVPVQADKKSARETDEEEESTRQSNGLPFVRQYSYQATLSFPITDRAQVDVALRAIVERLRKLRYEVTVTTKAYDDYDARIVAVLPLSHSCQRAEDEILSAAKRVEFPDSGHVAIKERSGSMTDYRRPYFWREIHPGSRAWGEIITLHD